MANEKKDRCEPQREGIAVYCAKCGRCKKPRGRSAPLVMANSLCDYECPDYRSEPKPGILWPGETCEQFGYTHSHEATRIHTPVPVEEDEHGEAE